MTTFIDAHREEYGVEPICEVVPTCLSADRSPRRPTTSTREESAIRHGSPSVLAVTQR